jgi:Family of unknown function (DUF6348)
MLDFWVQVLVRDKLVIEEAFAGVGQGDARLYDGLGNFTVNSFHVLLAAFWGKNDPEQVTTREWVAGGKRYTRTSAISARVVLAASQRMCRMGCLPPSKPQSNVSL